MQMFEAESKLKTPSAGEVWITFDEDETRTIRIINLEDVVEVTTPRVTFDMRDGDDKTFDFRRKEVASDFYTINTDKNQR